MSDAQVVDAPQGAEPVHRTEARSMATNPPGSVAPLDALRKVLLYTMADPFGLLPEEVAWAGWCLDEVLAPLVGREPDLVTLAVRQEMLEGTYSAALEATQRGGDRTVAYDPQVVYADADDWVAVLMSTITQCYTLRQVDEAAMYGRFVNLLRELGVGDRQHPRGQRYLPNVMRERLNAQS